MYTAQHNTQQMNASNIPKTNLLTNKLVIKTERVADVILSYKVTRVKPHRLVQRKQSTHKRGFSAWDKVKGQVHCKAHQTIACMLVCKCGVVPHGVCVFILSSETENTNKSVIKSSHYTQ